MENSPTSFLLAVDVSATLDQELDHGLAAVPDGVVQHTPAVLVLGGQVGALGKKQRCDGDV